MNSVLCLSNNTNILKFAGKCPFLLFRRNIHHLSNYSYLIKLVKHYGFQVTFCRCCFCCHNLSSSVTYISQTRNRSMLKFLYQVKTQYLVLCVCCVDRYLSFCLLPFDYGVVCPSSIYRFWLPLWYLQTLLLNVPLNAKLKTLFRIAITGLSVENQPST